MQKGSRGVSKILKIPWLLQVVVNSCWNSRRKGMTLDASTPNVWVPHVIYICLRVGFVWRYVDQVPMLTKPPCGSKPPESKTPVFFLPGCSESVDGPTVRKEERFHDRHNFSGSLSSSVAKNQIAVVVSPPEMCRLCSAFCFSCSSAKRIQWIFLSTRVFIKS